MFRPVGPPTIAGSNLRNEDGTCKGSTTRSSSGPGTTAWSRPVISRGRAKRFSSSNDDTSSAEPVSPKKSSPASRSRQRPTSTACSARRSSRELGLHQHGFELLERMPSSFSPFLDGRYLLMGGDAELTQPRNQPSSARRTPRRTPSTKPCSSASPMSSSRRSSRSRPTCSGPASATCGVCSNSAGRSSAMGTRMGEAVEVLTGPARNILDRWFESEQLKATLATDAVIGAMASPSMPGTAYVLFHHVMGETNGKRGVWAYVKGGMGSLSNALAAVARANGANIRTEAVVKQILIKDGRAVGRRDGQRRRVPRPDRREQRRRQRDLQQAHGPERPAARSSVPGRQPHRLRQRHAQDQRRPRPPAKFQVPARSRGRGRSIAAPSISAPIRTTSSAPTTTPNTVGPRPTRSSNARCRQPSIPAVAPPWQALALHVHPIRPLQAQPRATGTIAKTPSPTAASTSSRSTRRGSRLR